MNQVAHEGLPSVGDQIQQRYRLDSVLAHGGMGVVYRAHDMMLDRAVAVKVLPRSLDEGVVRQRFLREARLAASVRHRHVVDIFDAGFLEQEQPYLVMELLQGEPLHEKLRRAGAMKWYRAGVMCTQLCRGVGAVHAAGIIHRDLKPSNVFLVWGPELFVKLIDFGVSKSLDSDLTQITEPGLAVGTPSYMAPEQVLGKGADQRTDVYAIGATLYEALTGKSLVKPDKHVHRVFDAILRLDAPPPSTLRSDGVDLLDGVTRKALARDPAERFASCAELGAAVEAQLETVIPRGRV